MDVNSERHLPVLQALADGIRDLFPNGVEFHLGSPRNFFALWPLENQPPELTQWSRTVSIHFSDQFLEAFDLISDDHRRAYVQDLRSIIGRSMIGFDDGRQTRRYAVKGALVIDLTNDLAI
jgi:hypothetical protein